MIEGEEKERENERELEDDGGVRWRREGKGRNGRWEGRRGEEGRVEDGRGWFSLYAPDQPGIPYTN